MSIFAPIWLILLVPFSVLLAYLLLARRRRVKVPFVNLWRGPVQGASTQSAVQNPPLWMILTLAAILSGIFAAAQPVVYSSHDNVPLTIIFDNGLTMIPHAARTIERAAAKIRELTGPGAVRFVRVSDGQVIQTDRAGWVSHATPSTLRPLDTSAILPALINRELSQSASPIFVVSNQKLSIIHPRLFQIAADQPAANVGFVHVSLREDVRPQLMASIRNDSALTQTTLKLNVRDQSIVKPIDLPPPGEKRDYFIDLPEFTDRIEARIDADDDLPIDNVAFLVRSGAWPSIEIRGDVGEPLRRMVEVYSRNRPRGDGSMPIVVTSSIFQLAPDSRGVAVVAPSESLRRLPGRIGIEFGEHPLLRFVDWKSLADARAAESPGEGWNVLLRSGELVLLACREEPARQVWVGFDSPGFASTRDFVIFWTNVLDWLGQGGASFGYEPLAPLERNAPPPDAPGIYQRTSGDRVAMNVVDVKLHPHPASLTHLPTELSPKLFRRPIPLSGWACLLALLLLCAASYAAASRHA